MDFFSRRTLAGRSLGLAGSAAAFSVLLWASGAAGQTTLPGGQILNETWTQAGSPYIVQGDLIVPVGSFLHIEAGVDVQIAGTDMQSSLPDTARVAISVLGALQVNGTALEPVRFHAQAGTSFETWHGLVIDSSATEAKLTWAVLEHAREGVDSSSALLEISACEFATNRFQGVRLNDGAALFDRVLLRNMSNSGVRVNGGAVTMTNVIALDNANHGFHLAGGTVTIINSAAHSNDFHGMSVNGANVDVLNTLLTENGSYGVFRNAGQIDVVSSDVWGNVSGSYNGTVTAVAVISTNPQYVDGGNGILTLQSTSVCIDAGVSNTAPANDFNNIVRPLDGDGLNGAEHDIGPHEYVAMPICGDAQLNNGEVCDDGAGNGTYGFCNADCTGPGAYCGDNNLDAANEECDDGNTTAGDGCDGSCQNENAGSGGGDTGSGGQTAGSGGNTSGSGGSGTGAGTTNPCVPGEQITCGCPSGQTGIQSCSDDGAGYGTCTCSGNGAGDSESGCALAAPPSKPTGAPALLLLLGAALFLSRRS